MFKPFRISFGKITGLCTILLLAAAGCSSSDSSGDGAGKVVVFVSGYGQASVDTYSFDSTTGALAMTSSAATPGMNPSYIAIAPSKHFLYVTDESETSSVTGYSIGAAGSLTKLNTVATGGKGTAHIAISPDAKSVIAANYDSDTLSVLALNADGTVGDKTDEKTGCPSGHNVLFDPSGKFVLVACKSDVMTMPTDPKKDPPRILFFSLADGKLTPSATPELMFGADPRHMTFDASHKHVYVMTEKANLLYWFDYDGATGLVSNPQMVSTLPATGMVGAGGHLAFNGNFLYAENRTDNSLAIFSVDPTGKPSIVSWQTTGVDWVREFAFDPSGKFLLAAEQMTSKLSVFKVDSATGKLTTVGSPTMVAAAQMPAMVAFLTLP